MEKTVPSQKPKGLESASAKAIRDHKNDVPETNIRQIKASTNAKHLIELLTEEDINFIEERS